MNTDDDDDDDVDDVRSRRLSMFARHTRTTLHCRHFSSNDDHQGHSLIEERCDEH